MKCLNVSSFIFPSLIVFVISLLIFFANSISTNIKSSSTFDNQIHSEDPYRPLYHLSSKDGRIGDPNGTIRYMNNYHLFGWREHFISNDLVHWRELPSPMHGGDGTFSYFSGSVVVDTANTSGFKINNLPPMIAIYTMHHRNNSETPNTEEQAISVSTDHIRFDFWEGNPVIPSDEQFFRDPQVFWDEKNNRWAMVVVKSNDKAIEIYSSKDLKSWNYESSFGPLGARRAFWEVPDLFQMPLDGNPDIMKWVMICGVGPNTIQYWVGEFDGKTFTPDDTTTDFLVEGIGLNGELFEDFESDKFNKWEVEGTAFTKPLSSKIVSGYLGNNMALSADPNEKKTGKLVSSSFVIEKPYINLLLAGSDSDSVGVQIWVNGEQKVTINEIGSDNLIWTGINVSDWIGEQAILKIIDEGNDKWIAVDHIIFSDVLYDTGREHAYWVDWGEDFYAARTYRDYDGVDERTLWIAWLGNWTYARDLPTSWGGSAQSIPREVELVTSKSGYTLRQRPISELAILRSEPYIVEQKVIDGLEKLDDFIPNKNSYEVKATFELDDLTKQNFGFNVAANGENRLTIGYDASTSNVYIDRTKSGNVEFHPEFAVVSNAPVQITNDEITLHFFIDQLSVEVFVNDGETVLTSKFFPDESDTGIELFSINGKTNLIKMNIWELSTAIVAEE